MSWKGWFYSSLICSFRVFSLYILLLMRFFPLAQNVSMKRIGMCVLRHYQLYTHIRHSAHVWPIENSFTTLFKCMTNIHRDRMNQTDELLSLFDRLAKLVIQFRLVIVHGFVSFKIKITDLFDIVLFRMHYSIETAQNNRYFSLDLFQQFFVFVPCSSGLIMPTIDFGVTIL